ncbi:hypothetical protein ACFVAJ_17435 [Agromyces sp. NPDC057679]|uniref:hypothetical protein n=1 Tax=Agromyces sp. NPDC057679 TaxID=3346207 RepID=UPI00366C7B11
MTSEVPADVLERVTVAVEKAIEKQHHARRLYPDLYAGEVARAAIDAIGLMVTDEFMALEPSKGDALQFIPATATADEETARDYAADPDFSDGVARRSTLFAQTDWKRFTFDD